MTEHVLLISLKTMPKLHYWLISNHLLFTVTSSSFFLSFPNGSIGLKKKSNCLVYVCPQVYKMQYDINLKMALHKITSHYNFQFVRKHLFTTHVNVCMIIRQSPNFFRRIGKKFSSYIWINTEKRNEVSPRHITCMLHGPPPNNWQSTVHTYGFLLAVILMIKVCSVCVLPPDYKTVFQSFRKM